MRKLKLKQIEFAKNYCNPKSESYGNALKSYVMAGYTNNKGAGAIAIRALRGEAIQQFMTEYCKELQAKAGEKSIREQLNEDYTLAHIKQHLERCIADKDRTNTTATLKLLAQFNGLLIDKKEVSQHNSYTVPTRPSMRAQWLQDQQELLVDAGNAGTGLPINIVDAVLTQGNQVITDITSGQ